MALNLTRDANLERYKDLDFNFTLHPVTGELTTLTAEDAIRRSLKNLVMTKFYDIPFKPFIESDTNNLLFENANDFTSFNVEDGIRSIVAEFEPRVAIESVSVNIEAEHNLAGITIIFYILSQPEPITLNTIIERNK